MFDKSNCSGYSFVIRCYDSERGNRNGARPVTESPTRPTVVIQAAPFCFGPISTSLAVADELRRQGVSIVWMAEGTALELLQADGDGQTGDCIIPFRLV